MGGVDEAGRPIEVKDPLAPKLRFVSDSAHAPANKVAALLAVEDVFHPDLADQLRAPVTAAAELLWAVGAQAAVAKVVAALSD